MTDVFLSYPRNANHEGAIDSFAERLKTRLHLVAHEKLEFSVFIDKESISGGDVWERKILTAVEEARVFIPLVQPRYLDSEWCRRELNHFHSLNGDRGILPVQWETLDETSDGRAAWELLSSIQHVSWLPEERADDSRFERLVKDTLKAWSKGEQRRDLRFLFDLPVGGFDRSHFGKVFERLTGVPLKSFSITVRGGSTAVLLRSFESNLVEDAYRRLEASAKSLSRDFERLQLTKVELNPFGEDREFFRVEPALSDPPRPRMTDELAMREGNQNHLTNAVSDPSSFLDQFRLDQLQALAKELGVRYAGLNKRELIEALQGEPSLTLESLLRYLKLNVLKYVAFKFSVSKSGSKKVILERIVKKANGNS